MQIQGHATQLEMQRGGCGGTNAFVALLGPPWAFGHRRSLMRPPRCVGVGEHPWVLCPPASSWFFPRSPPSPPGVSGAWRGGSFPAWGHGWWHWRFTAVSPRGGSGATTHVLGIDVGVLPSPSGVPTLRGDPGECCPTDGMWPMDGVPQGTPSDMPWWDGAKPPWHRRAVGKAGTGGGPCLTLSCLQTPAVRGARGAPGGLLGG